MGIYRGPGGTGDAINDASSEATLVSQLVTQAQESEANASTSATAAANSASAASTSASNAATAETNAETAEANAETAEANAETAQAAAEAAQAAAEAAQLAAETAETNAETAETNAETAQSAAATSATNAASSASAASTSATNASNSATAAATSATNASNSATAAATSATNASNSATSASGSASTATTQASNASTSASNAATSETNAASSASTATTQAGIATTQASNAATSATNAASSASAASTSASNASSSATSAANAQSAAETARDQTLAAFDSFDDRYLGQKATAPTVDNDGNALVAGALYFNTTTNEMKVYDGTQWLNAYASLSGALLATSNLSDLNNAATARDNLGVEIGVDVQAYDAQLADIAGLTPTDNGVIIGNGTNFVVESGATLKTSLGLTIGTNVQAWDADLDTWATKTAPSGTVVGTSDSQTLTNKTLTAPVISTISNTGTLTLPSSTDTLVGRATSDTLTNKTLALGSNTVSGTLAQFNTAVTDADLASLAGTETLTNKTLTNPTINGFTGNTSVVNIGSGQFYKDASGLIGIGTNSPATYNGLLNVKGSDRAVIGYFGGTTYAARLGANGSFATVEGVDAASGVSSYQPLQIGGSVLSLATGGSERMRIDASGNVGIGTTAPPQRLTVWGAGTLPSTIANTQLLVGHTDGFANAGIALVAAAGNASSLTFGSTASPTLGRIEYDNTNNWMRFLTNGTNERMRIDSSGNVGIGTTTALSGVKLNVNGGISTATGLNVAGYGGFYNTANHFGVDNYLGSTRFYSNGSNTSTRGGFEFHVSSSDGSLDNTAVIIDSNSNLAFNSGYGSAATAYGCRAWVNFDGTGTVAIRASGNVSSITDNGTGNYTLNFTTTMPDTSYTVVGMASGQPSVQSVHIVAKRTSGTASTSQYNIQVSNLAEAVQDSSFINVSVFR